MPARAAAVSGRVSITRTLGPPCSASIAFLLRPAAFSDDGNCVKKVQKKSLPVYWRRVPFRRSAVGWVRYHAGKPDIEGKLRRRQRYSGKAEEAGAVLRICNQLKKLQDRLLSHNRIFISETFLYSTAYQLHLFFFKKVRKCDYRLETRMISGKRNRFFVLGFETD